MEKKTIITCTVVILVVSTILLTAFYTKEDVLSHLNTQYHFIEFHKPVKFETKAT